MSDNGKQDSPSSPIRVAAVQMNSGDNLNQNLELAARLLAEAAADGCALAVLPENFAFMGARGKDKLQHAEEPGAGPIQDFLADTARSNNLWIISGSISPQVIGSRDAAMARRWSWTRTGIRRIVTARFIYSTSTCLIAMNGTGSRPA